MVRVRSTLSRTILYAIVVSPLLISVIVRSYGWVVLLANNGVINGTLLSLGLIDRPLRMLGTFGSVIVATVHVPPPLHDAAHRERACSRWTRCWSARAESGRLARPDLLADHPAPEHAGGGGGVRAWSSR
jgi:hypothetical protein